MAVELEEILSDVQSYLSVGDTDNAVAVLFEGLRTHTSPQAEVAIATVLTRHCRSLWKGRKLDEARSLSNAVIEETLRQTGNTIETDYLDLYITALAETGSSPFPFKRMFRQRNLLRVFGTAKEPEAGDIAECGCARGLSTLQLALAQERRRAGWQGEGFHVFDSFAGLSEPGREDAIDASTKNSELLATDLQRGRFAVPREVVATNLHRLFPRIELHAGWIPDVFSGQPERRYRFVHLDVDLYQPTLESLVYFFPRLVEGAIVITDDYGWPGAKKAFDEFARQNALELQLTGTDQAYFVKGESSMTGSDR